MLPKDLEAFAEKSIAERPLKIDGEGAVGTPDERAVLAARIAAGVMRRTPIVWTDGPGGPEFLRYDPAAGVYVPDPSRGAEAVDEFLQTAEADTIVLDWLAEILASRIAELRRRGALPIMVEVAG